MIAPSCANEFGHDLHSTALMQGSGDNMFCIEVHQCRQLTVMRVSGFRFFFYSREKSEPAHIHVEQGDRVAKFSLNPVNLAESHGFRVRGPRCGGCVHWSLSIA
jgi:hypothetical protein